MPQSQTVSGRSRIAWIVLAVLLAIETIGLAWLFVSTLAAGIGSGERATQVVSIILMVGLGLVWALATLIGSLRVRVGWVRGSALTIHVMLFALATGCLQLGMLGWQSGFGLVGLAIAGFAAAILARPTDRA